MKKYVVLDFLGCPFGLALYISDDKEECEKFIEGYKKIKNNRCDMHIREFED